MTPSTVASRAESGGPLSQPSFHWRFIQQSLGNLFSFSSLHSVSVRSDSFPTHLRTETSVIKQLWQNYETALKLIFIAACTYTIISYTVVPLALTSISNLCLFLFISGEIGGKIQKEFCPFFNIQIEESPAENRVYSVKTHAFKDSLESFEGKKELIRKAEHSVLLSGNYCGKQVFQEVLKILETKLETNPNFKVIILSSSLFLTRSNYTLIDRLNDKYPYFHFVITDDVYTHTHGLHKTINHVKGLVIDGSEAIIGGDGLEDKYGYARGIGDKRVKCPALCTDEDHDEALGLMGTLAELILPRGFRDFAHHIVGDEFCRHTAEQLYSFSKYWIQVYGNKYVNGKPINFTFEDCVPPQARALCSNQLTEKAEFFAISPELSRSYFEDRMVDLINQAKNGNRIYIDHMFFQPTKLLMSALLNSANRGVRILIVTNGYDKQFSPKSHESFGDLNRASYLELIERTNDNSKKNIEVYEYGQKHSNTPRKTTLHKKVMVVETPDGSFVIFGNANIGYKSIQHQCDYEIGVIVKGESLAKANIKIIEDDAYKIKRKCHNSLGEEIIHTSGPFIGKIKRAPLSRKIFSKGEWHQSFVPNGSKGPPPINRYNYWIHRFLRPLNG